ncbi:MAG: DUF998 domain-containing protein [Verrucomicrobia bacterium]|nr:DUF998 domain-containing protein [Verrucomicrobiota bacterium]MBU1734872.1 DUF998 domain-containing protein [Verrucomicrobiota bacterium]MBU1856016.1 DUF998 domain-containing protein [Verrucomicrobiota bacterium]
MMKLEIPGKRAVPLLLVFGLAIFATGFVLSVLLYPGSGEQTQGYRFFHDFISALGVTKISGRPNPYSSLFNFSLGFAMLLLLPFWYFRTKYLPAGKAVGQVVFTLCAFFSLGMTGVALSPYNLHPTWHNISVYSAFACIMPGVLLIIFLSDRRRCGPSYKAAWGIVGLAIVAVNITVWALVKYHIASSIPLYAIAQKIDAGTFFIWIAVETIMFKKLCGDALPAGHRVREDLN